MFNDARHKLMTAALLAMLCCSTFAAPSNTILDVKRVDRLPTIDGEIDPLWTQLDGIESTDPVSQVPVSLKAVHDGKSIAILASYPDQDESRHHRDLIWNQATAHYQLGPQREDVLVLKWRLSNDTGKLTLQEEVPYEADIWFWKALRTDPVGYADDKIQTYSLHKGPRSKLVVSPSGQFFYLNREGDSGRSSYMSSLYNEYAGNQVPKYLHRTPSGSRADIQAKGRWVEGRWQIEMRRLLHTGNRDDIQLSIGSEYDFAVSRYEIAGRKPEPDSEQPLYGSGEVGPLLRARILP